MKFVWTTIYVKNMEESLKFYQEVLGLPLKRRFSPNPMMELAFLGEGETEVELIADVNKPEVAFGEDISMGFMVPSIEKMGPVFEKHGIVIHSGPFKPNPQMIYIFIQDPNGMKIQLVERVEL